MRMWNVDPKNMCRKHLLGEHVELHMFIGSIQKRKSLDGFVKNNLVEPKKFVERHQELVDEMIARVYNHKSPLPEYDISYLPIDVQNATVNTTQSLQDLLGRCEDCLKRYYDVEEVK